MSQQQAEAATTRNVKFIVIKPQITKVIQRKIDLNKRDWICRLKWSEPMVDPNGERMSEYFVSFTGASMKGRCKMIEDRMDIARSSPARFGPNNTISMEADKLPFLTDPKKEMEFIRDFCEMGKTENLPDNKDTLSRFGIKFNVYSKVFAK